MINNDNQILEQALDQVIGGLSCDTSQTIKTQCPVELKFSPKDPDEIQF